jgi:hypothetical protein
MSSLLLGLALLATQLPGPAAPEAGLDTERRLSALVDEGRAAERVRALCALGPRMGGTPSGHAAAELVALSYLSAGLSARIVEDPPQWCHSESAWALSARRGEEQVALASAWPYGNSPSARGTAVLGLVPRAGAALLAARRPRGRDQPAAAVVLIDGSTTLDGAYPVVQHVTRGAAAPVFGLSRADGELLRSWLAQGALVRIDYELEARIEEARPRTVLAALRRPGMDPWKDDYFLFCAHGDSDAGGPGADDNASGVAAVLEIAEAWSAAIAAGVVAPPPFGVRFAVWGSEIHSTRDYVARRVPGEGRLLGVINYDQAGYGSGADQLNIEPDDLPANVALVNAVFGVLRDQRGAPGFPERFATNKSLGGTDSYVFSGSKYCVQNSVPAVTVFASAWGEPAEHARTPGMPGESWSERDSVSVDYDNYYHSAGDTPENTTDREPWNTAWCARAGLLGARRYLQGLAAEPR